MTTDPDTSGPSANPGRREVGTPGALTYLQPKPPYCETLWEGMNEFRLTRVGKQQEDL